MRKPQKLKLAAKRNTKYQQQSFEEDDLPEKDAFENVSLSFNWIHRDELEDRTGLLEKTTEEDVEDPEEIPALLQDLYLTFVPPNKPVLKFSKWRRQVVREFMEEEYNKLGEVYRAR